jgi:predicted aminopeptidase
MTLRTLGRRGLQLVAGLFALGVVLVLALPAGRYLLRGAWEETRILLRRRSLTAMVADSSVSAQIRERLQLVLDARRFAGDQLGLRAGESFTTYARVDHDTLVLVLTAAYRDRLEPVRWWFPIVGSVPYKGYFDFDAARRARDDLEQRGFDTVLGASSAFSTLGWFNDPLLSIALGRDTVDLANTVIHELLHNTEFLKGQVEFDESFASFVGARGAAAFFRARGDDDAARQADLEWGDEKVMSGVWRALARSLDSAYAAWPADSSARVHARDTVYARGRRALADSIGPLLRTVSPARLARMPLNNAVLLARRAYAHDLDLFDAVLTRTGGDLRAAIARIREVTQGSGDAFGALRTSLGSPLPAG